MRAAQVTEFGPIEGITIAEVERPAPGPGQVLVRVTAAGVNFADAGMVMGTNRRRETPFTPGVEAAGVVEQANGRSGEHTSELQALLRISYAVFCLKKKTETQTAQK